MSRKATWAVVPVKVLDHAKKRLAGVFDPEARIACELAAGIAVEELLKVAARFGPVLVLESLPAESHESLVTLCRG